MDYFFIYYIFNFIHVASNNRMLIVLGTVYFLVNKECQTPSMYIRH